VLTKDFVGKRSSRTDASGSRKASVSLCVVVWRLGAKLIPHVEVNRNPWGREAREIYGLQYEEPDSDREAR
jgi:hypothetical protein